MPIVHTICGTTPEGQTIEQYTLTNANGVQADILNLGGIIRTLLVPDRNGNLGDIALGFDSYEPYLGNHPYFGALIGRSGNRINQGRISINGKSIQLAQNSSGQHLHGGNVGYDHRVWDIKAYETEQGPAVELHYFSPDGEENYPGNLDITVIYTLTDENVLRLDYTATTDADTIVNLTNHAYFNLKGSGDILDHVAYLPASRFIEINSDLIPTGNLASVEGTPMDFRTPTVIGERINSEHEQIKLGMGYDHCYAIDKAEGEFGLAARVSEPSTGRVLEAWTSEPGVQLYTGNFLDGSVAGKGNTYSFRTGFCLETQHFPDAPNQPNFPSTILRAGETYRHTTEYRFLTEE